METRELLGKVEMLIDSQKLPHEVKDVVKEIYIEYHSAYIKFLSNIQLAIESDEKAQIELNNIVDYTNRDYEDIIDASDKINQASYLIKLEHMVEDIENVVNSIVRNREINISSEVLTSTLDVDELTKKEKAQEEKKIKTGVTDVENRRCAEQIKTNLISEIESSRDALIMKLSSIKLNQINQDFIKYSKEQFFNEIELINSKAKLKLPLEIKEILDAQDDKITNDIIDIYGKYVEEEKHLTDREKFASNIRAKVSVEEAIRKVNEEQTQENTISNLPENEIK